MSRSVTGLDDPREGAWPEPQEYCPHGIAREAGCGTCHADDIDRTTQEASFEALAAAFAVVLDRVSQTDDETKGAALAARFGDGDQHEVK